LFLSAAPPRQRLLTQDAGRIRQGTFRKDRADVLEDVFGATVQRSYTDPAALSRHFQTAARRSANRYRPQVENVKSDANIYALVNRMTARTDDAHTRFNNGRAVGKIATKIWVSTIAGVSAPRNATAGVVVTDVLRIKRRARRPSARHGRCSR